MSVTVSISVAHERQAKPRFQASVEKALTIVWTWRRRMRDRAELRRLLARADDYMLADVGLNRARVADEAGKPFWRS